MLFVVVAESELKVGQRDGTFETQCKFGLTKAQVLAINVQRSASKRRAKGGLKWRGKPGLSSELAAE